MQLTARQRYFVRIVVWALPISVALGAVFGRLNVPNDESVRGYTQRYEGPKASPEPSKSRLESDT